METPARGATRSAREHTGPALEPAIPEGRRELEVLKLIAAGMSNAEIAVELTISQATAARHVSNVFDKLDVHTRAMATDAAHRLGMLG